MAKKRKSKTKNKKKSKVSARRGNKPSTFAFLFKWGVTAGIWGLITLFFVSVYFFVTMPDISDIQTIRQNAGVEIYDRNDRRIARFGQSRGKTVLVNDMPSHVKQAVIAIEDHRFYSHPGVDLLGIARAMVTNVKHGGFVQGGSTLTQQLAKNLFLKPDKTLSRKIREVYLSFWLEQKLTKDEILTAYLNRVYFGSGAYGITAAANRYYNTSAENLNLAQAAQLAASLKAPSKINPIAGKKDSIERSKLVLDAMLAQEFITPPEKKQAESYLLRQQNISIENPVADEIPHYYTDWVLDQIGYYASDITDGLKIYTGFDSDIHSVVRANLDEFLFKEAPNKSVQDVAVIVMGYDGMIRTLIGGHDYSRSQFNRATQALRQPGSAFKPFVYMAAIEKGYSPKSRILDKKFGRTYTYTPKNFDDKYYGEVSLELALAKSLNTAAVRLSEDVGIGAIEKTAQNFGITTPVKRDLSSALGSSEVKLIDMTAAYAVFANNGYAVYPYTIRGLYDNTLSSIYERDEDVDLTRIASYRDVSYMKQMLKTVVLEGTGKNAYFDGLSDFGGKTGTSQNYRDAWFIGYGNGYVVGIWMGNDDNSPMEGVTGGGPPARLWRNIMQDITEVRPVVSYKQDYRPGLFERLIGQWSVSDVKPDSGTIRLND